MKFGEHLLIITNHAYQRYCQRVKPIEYGELRESCMKHLADHNYRREGVYLQLAGIWWTITAQDGKLYFITCLGLINSDLPQDKKAAKLRREKRKARMRILHNPCIKHKQQALADL